MVAITGNVAVPLLGRDSFQEVDITGITMPITKHNFIVKRVEELADTVREAFRIAGSGRPGPVLIDLPKDVTAAECEYEPQPAAGARPVPPPKEERLQMAVEKLNHSRKPLIYFGGGVLISSGAEAELLALAEKQDIPVCCLHDGSGRLPAPSSACGWAWWGCTAPWRPTAPPGNAICCWSAGPGFPTGWRGAAPALPPTPRWFISISTMRNSIKTSPPPSGWRGI